MSKSDAACKGCGVQIIFQDGQESVKCEYCGLVNFAPKPEEPIKSNAVPGPQSGANTSEIDALIRRAYLLLEEGNFAHADNCLEQALNLFPENAAAYIGKLMVEACAKKENELGKSTVSLDNYNNYKNALQFASPEQKERLEGYNRQIADRKSREFADYQRQIAYETEISNQKAAKAKKIWIIVLIIVAAIIVVAAISSGSGGTSQQAKNKATLPPAATQAVAASSATQAVAASASASMQPQLAVQDGVFNFTADDVYETQIASWDKETVFTNRHTYLYPDYTADWAQSNNLKLICFVDPANNNVKAVTLACESDSADGSYGKRCLAYYHNLLNLCSITDTTAIDSALGVPNYTGPKQATANGICVSWNWNDNYTYFMFYPEDTTLDVNSLPFEIDRPADFFTDDARRGQFKELCTNYAFSDILTLVNDYITQYSPAETDSAYAIAEQAQAGADAMQNCSIIKDEFNDKISIYYNGVEDLSSDINLLPYINGKSTEIITGFIASDWLNFTTVSIKADSEVIENTHYKDDAPHHSTVDGGVLEKINTVLDQDDIEKILKSEKTLIRFTNNDDETRDHTLTESERNALQSISTIRSANATLTGLCTHWEND